MRVLLWAVSVLLCVCVWPCYGGYPLMELITEQKVSALVNHDAVFEASGVSLWNQSAYAVVVFDSRTDFALVPFSLLPGSGVLMGNDGMYSQGFEGVSFDFQGTNKGDMIFFSAIESLWNNATNMYNSVLVTYDKNFNMIADQWLEGVDFVTDNKGFEGVAFLRYNGTYSDRYLFMLCEGNDCTTSKTGGDGRIKVFAWMSKSHKWELIDTVKLPSTVDFADYSGIDVTARHITVISQTSSKLWVGRLQVKDDDDFSIPDDGEIYDFPKDDKGQIVYCTLEGIAMITPHEDFDTIEPAPLPTEFMLSSDQAKSDMYAGCQTKDQSVHRFRRPSK